ncbi:dihydrofolate reductase family protein [Streptomyces ovatisporus]|uniref:Dihydrofolate reductase family protein n=1 Tax=Streptomyces ovatisporus TaxID=1128682 RepID=A0ABV9A5K2_9ACTN
MSSTGRSGARRRIVAWASVSMDGFTSGPDGPEHDTWLYEHASQEQTGAYFEGIWRGADTALLGRTNYEGFFSVWPSITRDPATDARTRDLGKWLDTVEKVVFSRTLKKADWHNARIAQDLEAEVTALRDAPGRDVLVLNSASIIQALLRADLVDDLRFAVVPVLLGGGLRLFPEGLPASRWSLAETTALKHGAVGLHYRRA